jgi:dihydroneopterin aldolase
MSDRIFVTGLLIHAHHGVMEHEAKVGQRFMLDLELTTDLSDAARSDKLADTVSYSAIVDTASRAFTAHSHKLVEAAAGAVADAAMRSRRSRAPLRSSATAKTCGLRHARPII